jgi:hypothetical protein
VSVDLWVRAEGVSIGGARRRLVKRSLVLMVGVGDIEQTRVCPSLCLPRLPPALTWDRGTSLGVVERGYIGPPPHSRPHRVLH